MYQNHHKPFLFFFLLLAIIAGNGADDHHCNSSSLPDPLTLDPDQTTVLISGYSPARIPLLRSLAASYSSHPLVAAVLILWFNPSVVPGPLLSLPRPVSVVLSPSSSLNSRFLPRPQIRTRSVLVSDDDVRLSPRSLSLALRAWSSHQEAAVGFFARSHDLDLSARSWIYTLRPDRHSIVLTKLMVLKTEYLYKYSCREDLEEARKVVERERNCEDILMNFLVAMESGGARPVLVEGRRRVRDWGDPRNNNDKNSSSSSSDSEDVEANKVGLSSRGDHWKKRGHCIGEFHRSIGKMPLRFGYGKVVEGAAEQGLCRKAGRLVPCDAQD